MSILTYIKETKAEMVHVSWPTKKQAIGYSLLVIAICIGAAVFLGVFDYFFSSVLKLVI